MSGPVVFLRADTNGDNTPFWSSAEGRFGLAFLNHKIAQSKKLLVS